MASQFWPEIFLESAEHEVAQEKVELPVVGVAELSGQICMLLVLLQLCLRV